MIAVAYGVSRNFHTNQTQLKHNFVNQREIQNEIAF